MKISLIIGRVIFDAMTAEGIDWEGTAFDLLCLPSADSHYKDAVGDIWKPTVANYDWD
jgi:hypothetical protein